MHSYLIFYFTGGEKKLQTSEKTRKEGALLDAKRNGLLALCS